MDSDVATFEIDDPMLATLVLVLLSELVRMLTDAELTIDWLASAELVVDSELLRMLTETDVLVDRAERLLPAPPPRPATMVDSAARLVLLCASDVETLISDVTTLLKLMLTRPSEVRMSAVLVLFAAVDCEVIARLLLTAESDDEICDSDIEAPGSGTTARAEPAPMIDVSPAARGSTGTPIAWRTIDDAPAISAAFSPRSIKLREIIYAPYPPNPRSEYETSLSQSKDFGKGV